MIFDLIAAHQPQGGSSNWTPAQLFQNGEVGFWFDASDLSTLFQDNTGSTPVTTSGQVIGLWKNKIASQPVNFNLSQGTTSAKPLYTVSGSKSYASFDGVDDSLSSSSNFPQSTVNGLTIAIGQRKSSNETAQLYSVGSNSSMTNQASGGVSANVQGIAVNSITAISLTAGNVLMEYSKADPSGVVATVRVNGSATTGAIPTLTGFNGIVKVVGNTTNDCLISQFVLINRILSPGEIALLETFIASKQ